MRLRRQISLYKVTVLEFGGAGAEATPDWTLNAAGILTGLIAASVQVSFTQPIRAHF